MGHPVYIIIDSVFSINVWKLVCVKRIPVCSPGIRHLDIDPCYDTCGLLGSCHSFLCGGSICRILKQTRLFMKENRQEVITINFNHEIVDKNKVFNALTRQIKVWCVFYLYLYQYENVFLFLCLSVCPRFPRHFETDWETHWHKVAFCFWECSKTKK